MNKSFLCSNRFIYNSISNFTIEITQKCNFRCIYCCYSGNYSNMRTHTGKSMSKETILDSIEFIKHYAHKEDNIVVSFFGGEALLQVDQIVFIIDNLNAYFGTRISFDISTNGLLLTPDIIERFLKYNIGISVSLDGCRTIHDRNRILSSGEGTYDRIVANLLYFKNTYPDEYNKRIRILITVGSLEDIVIMNKNFEKFENLLGIKPPFVSHIYPNFKKKQLYKDDISLKIMFLNKAVEHKKRGMYDFYTIILDDLLKKTKKRFECDKNCTCIQLKTCLNNMYSVFIDVDGRLCPCEKFDTSHFIGDVKLGISIKLLQKWSCIYSIKRTFLCCNCKIIEYCTRCLADLKMSFSEQEQMCAIYRENIELAQLYKYKTEQNA